MDLINQDTSANCKNFSCTDIDKCNEVTSIRQNLSSSNQKVFSVRDKCYLNDQTEINFLKQCKLELSAEVIRWKEQNLKLQKENQAAVKKIEELQSVVNTLSKKNNDLEKSMMLSWKENKKLKMQTLVVDEENVMLHKRLSKVFNKYHSYPWSELLNKSSVSSFNSLYCSDISEQKKFENWQEVSQRLLEQMKLEMKDMQDFGEKMALSTKSLESEKEENLALSDSSVVKNNFHLAVQEAAQDVSHLHNEIEGIKSYLKAQNMKMQTIFSHFSGDLENEQNGRVIISQENVREKSVMFLKNANHLYERNNDHEKQFTRPSDESFRAYFTQQLNSSKSSEELKKIMQFYFNSEKQMQNSNSRKYNLRTENFYVPPFYSTSKEHIIRPSDRKENISKDKKNESYVSPLKQKIMCSTLEKRICPFCETVFPKDVLESDFESHVIAHLEAESASLLAEYEIL